jgi:Glycosyltransferase sugar-binding region containing DXD motif
MAIPKIIHYCWFGPKPIPELELKCMKSWKKFLPDYKLMLWDEKSFDIENSSQYVKEAYDKKLYPFVADYVRIYAMVEYGGVYLDTDMELLSSIDAFLENEAFTGFENKTRVAAGIMGCNKENKVFRQMLDYYNSVNFIDANNDINITTICSVMMDVLEEDGFEYKNSEQYLKNIHIYERDIFYPKKLQNGEFRITDKSVSIHHYSGSWLTSRQKIRGENILWRKICRPFLRKCKIVLLNLIGDKNTINFERKVRNWMR